VLRAFPSWLHPRPRCGPAGFGIDLFAGGVSRAPLGLIAPHLSLGAEDEGEDLGFLYHVADESGIILCLHTRAPKADPRIVSVSDRFPSAHIYERELVDLFGAKVEGLPPGNRYPLPDGWPEGQYPLRKDWKDAAAGAGLADGEES